MDEIPDANGYTHKDLWHHTNLQNKQKERTEAQYAATNITLDQADNGTDAQKQMALKSVLDWYYERYWSK